MEEMHRTRCGGRTGNFHVLPHQPTVPKSPGVPWKLSEPILLGVYEGSMTQAWWIKLSAIGSRFPLQALFPSWRLVWVLGLNIRTLPSEREGLPFPGHQPTLSSAFQNPPH